MSPWVCLRKSGTPGLLLWEMVRGLEDKGRRGPLFFSPTRPLYQTVLYNNKVMRHHWAYFLALLCYSCDKIIYVHTVFAT